MALDDLKLLQLIRATIINGAYQNHPNISPMRVDFENEVWTPDETTLEAFEEKVHKLET